MFHIKIVQNVKMTLIHIENIPYHRNELLVFKYIVTNSHEKATVCIDGEQDLKKFNLYENYTSISFFPQTNRNPLGFFYHAVPKTVFCLFLVSFN